MISVQDNVIDLQDNTIDVDIVIVIVIAVQSNLIDLQNKTIDVDIVIDMQELHLHLPKEIYRRIKMTFVDVEHRLLLTPSLADGVDKLGYKELDFDDEEE